MTTTNFSKGNLFWSRDSSGNISITKTKDNKTPTSTNVLYTQTISKDDWVAIVASMTSGGLTSVNLKVAKNLHG